jgi:hypothetical protein
MPSSNALAIVSWLGSYVTERSGKNLQSKDKYEHLPLRLKDRNRGRRLSFPCNLAVSDIRSDHCEGTLIANLPLA